MGIQRNRPQIKEEENSPEEELHEMDANNLSHREFRVMIMRIHNSMKKDIKIKSFYMAKENINKMKREPTIWENIFANDT